MFDGLLDPPTVILGVARSDVHVVGNQLIEMFLREHGYYVVNLGACVPLDEFADALDEHPAALAILIGSLNGHAVRDLAELPSLRAAGRLRRPVVVGGLPSIDGDARGAQERLLRLGVDHVLHDERRLLVLLDMLHAHSVGRSVAVHG